MITIDVDDLWARYKENGDIEARNLLLEQYVQLVKYVANKISFTLPPHVDQGDLISYGTFGLIDAIDKYDLSRGFKFETYAISRIRGAILDELRAQDWIPRSVRAKAKSIDKAQQKLGTELGRTPFAHEVASELEFSVDQYHIALGQVSNTAIVGLDEAIRSQEVENITIGDAVMDHRQSVEDTVDAEGLRKFISSTLTRLNDREKIVTTLYYFEGLSLGEIGKILGVTESRVCQIHSKALTEFLNNGGP